MKIKTQHIKIYEMQLKQGIKRNFNSLHYMFILGDDFFK